MATTIKYALQRIVWTVDEGRALNSTREAHEITHAPAVLWESNELWLEASVYLRRKALYIASTGGSQLTTTSHASSLSAYAQFLEEHDLEWSSFPEDRSERPTYRFRGYLLAQVDVGQMARSTAARHVSVIKQFYQWARANCALGWAVEPYRTRQVEVRFTNSVGLTGRKSVETTDLAIRATRVKSGGLEDGVHPIKLGERNQLMQIAHQNFRPEFVLILKLGFFTGMRIGTILDLTYSALRAHFPSRELEGCYSIEVGGKSGISSKGGVHYLPSIPAWLLEELLDYCKRPRRAIRQKRAATEDRDLVFMGQRDGQRLNGRSISPDMTHLRRIARAQGMRLPNFHFHCTRATFGTGLVLTLLDAGVPTKAILPVLMAAMGHSRADTSMRYVQFIENKKHLAEIATEYGNFLGLPQECAL